MNVFIGLSFVVALTLLSSVDCIKWKTCSGSQKGKVVDVQVKGCETSDVCQMIKGQNASFSITFDSNEKSDKLTAVVHGIISGVPIPFPLDNPDGCKDCGVSCPVQTGTRYTYNKKIYVSSSYPTIRLVVQWELQDADSNDIVCIQLPVEIVSGLEKQVKPLLWNKL